MKRLSERILAFEVDFMSTPPPSSFLNTDVGSAGMVALHNVPTVNCANQITFTGPVGTEKFNRRQRIITEIA